MRVPGREEVAWWGRGRPFGRLCLHRGDAGPGRGEQGQGEPRSSQQGPQGLAAAGTWGLGSAVHEGQRSPVLRSWGTHGWGLLQQSLEAM